MVARSKVRVFSREGGSCERPTQQGKVAVGGMMFEGGGLEFTSFHLTYKDPTALPATKPTCAPLPLPVAGRHERTVGGRHEGPPGQLCTLQFQGILGLEGACGMPRQCL
jgi:hypothetical protein